MKLFAPLFLAAAGLLSSSANGFLLDPKGRALGETCASGNYLVNHSVAESTQEIDIILETFPSEGLGLFEITFPDSSTAFGWCIDYERFIDSGVWSVDVFSAFDSDIHPTAVDKPQYFPNLAYLINTHNVGDVWPANGTYCPGGTLTFLELQGAVWYLMDDEQGQGTYYETNRIDCVAQEIAHDARVYGSDYELNCSNPNEQVPLVLVVDDLQEIVLNQTIISETNVHNVPGLCECHNRNGTIYGDPHFKTWTGAKYDYHGECDLVLLDHPSFHDGQGLQVHVRTTRVKHFSFVQAVAVQIGDQVLEFRNDVDHFWIDGEVVPPPRKHHPTRLGGFVVRRDPKALSIRLAGGGYNDRGDAIAKIDLIQRRNGFPAVVVDAGGRRTDIFKGSLGLLGEWSTGKTLARDGETVIPVVSNATEFALEWQVRGDTLFQEARFPQYPAQCTPADHQMPNNRLGVAHLIKQAEEACAHWMQDKEDCIFDVMATRDVDVALEGHYVVTNE